MISIRDLEVTFGRTVALSDLHLEIGPGIAGLFGPNAAGKSTLLRVIAGLQETTRGEVLWNEQPVNVRDEGFRRAVGYVGHDAGLYRALTVQENLQFFGLLYGTTAKIEQVVARLNLESLASTRVGELSAGLRRRAAVARALVHDPQILLLDEPYANLDDDAANLVSAAIRDWWSDGRHALVASHGAKRVKAFADASIILQRGHVVSHRARVAEGTR
ncbi:MAG TPA: heme ABC exporter ATP-binding protein CcmA [Actinomycetota bacterium]|nr:heme ABC exporter ATP-binding protein CcmA [Actinomycetota bacterium]